MTDRLSSPFGLLVPQVAVSAVLACAALFVGCVTEPDHGEIIILPAGVDRFIQEPTTLVADEVLIQAVRQYRGEVATIVGHDFHSKVETPDRLQLVNREPGLSMQPVALSFRNMRIEARGQIDIRFSDESLVRDGEDAVVLLMIANGVARMEGPGYELTAPRIVIRNDSVKAIGDDGQPWPVPAPLR